MTQQVLTIDATELEGLIKRLRRVENGPKLATVLAPLQRQVADMVRTEATNRAGQSRQMTRANASNQYRVNKASVKVIIGGSDGDRRWAAGAQFGAKKYPQFPPARRGGYTVYPAIKAVKADLAQLFGEAIVDAIESNNP